MSSSKENMVVLGAAESGVGTAILAKKLGMQVFVSDFGKVADKYKAELEKYQIQFEEGQHSQEIILAADVLVKSP